MRSVPGLIRLLALIVTVTLVLHSASAADASQRFGPRSLLDWQFVADPRISPDGRRIVYVRSTVNRDKDEYDNDLWIAEGAAPPRPLSSGAHDDRAPRWSPDGTRLGFLSNRSGKRQVHILDMRGGEAWQLTDDAEGVQTFAWSPDGRSVAFSSDTTLAGDAAHQPVKEALASQSSAKQPFVTENLNYRNDGVPGFKSRKRVHIWVVMADAGLQQTAKRITQGDFEDGSPVWSMDGKQIYFSAVRRADADYYANDTEIFAVPADGSAAPRALTDRRGPDDDPLPSPDGRWIAYTGNDETAAPQSTYVRHLYLMSSDGTQRRELAADFDRSVPDSMAVDVAGPRLTGNQIQWSSDSRRILFVSTDRGQTHLYEVSVANGDLAPLTRFRQGELREFTLSKTGTVAAVYSSPTQPAEIQAFPLAGTGRDGWRRVSRHTAELTAAARFSEYEELWYDSFDGTRIQGWVIKPPGFDAARRYPMILYIHGGPHAMYGTGFFHEFQVLAQAGYVVLITNPRGSTGYGERFANVIQYRYPGDDYRDLMTAVDLLVARGYVDEKRLGVAGGSGGGLLASWTVGHTDRFAAALVERAVTNWHSFVGTADLNDYFARHWFRDFPWRDSADYLGRSPLSYVEQVKTPVLVLHSEQDYRVTLDQGLQFYTALKMLKKPARLAVFADSSHGMSRDGRPSQRVTRLELIEQWFAERMK